MEPEKEMICVVCPIGCHLKICASGSGHAVKGNECERGRDYAISELNNPTRTVTSTVKMIDSYFTRLPVKTEHAFPKDRIMELMVLLKKIEVKPPVAQGQIILANVLDTGVNVVATKTIQIQFV